MNSAPAADAWKELCGTIFGSYDYGFEGKGAWVGHAILAIEGRPPLQATFVDRNTSIARKPEGEIWGTETITLKTPAGDSFEVCGKFTGSPASTPGLYTLHETGTIANGTGAFDHISGQVVVQGPFMFPDPAVTTGAPPWIAEIHGLVRGIR
jgi:hypothetical protein